MKTDHLTPLSSFLKFNNKSLIDLYFFLLVAFYFFAPLVTILRINRFDISGNFAYYFLVIRTLILVLMNFFIIISNKITQFNYFIIFFGFVVVYGQIIGMINEHDFSYILSDLARGILVLSTLLLLTNLDISTKLLEKLLKIFNNFIIISYIASEFWIYVISPMLNLRTFAGLGSQVLLIPLIYSLLKGKRVNSFFTLILIFVSGKRGVFLVAVIALTLTLLLRKASSKKISKKIILFSVIISFVTIIVIIFLLRSILEMLTGDFPIFVEKYLFSLSFDSYEDLVSISSGRLNQIEAILGKIKESFLYYLFIGDGHGVSIDYSIYLGEKKLFFDEFRNIHFSPLRLSLIYGISTTLIIYIYLFTLGVKVIKLFSISKEMIDMLFGIFIISFIFYTVFVYEILQEPIFWIIISLSVMRIKKIKNMALTKLNVNTRS